MSETVIVDEDYCVVTSDCECYEYDEETGDTKVDADGEFVPAAECFGDCHDDAMSRWEEVYRDWIARNNMNNATVIAITFRGVTWQSVSGVSNLQVEEMKDLSVFKLRGDYRLHIKRIGKTLSIERGSHDEYNATFEFQVTQNYCEECKIELVDARMMPDWANVQCQTCYDTEQILRERETNV